MAWTVTPRHAATQSAPPPTTHLTPTHNPTHNPTHPTAPTWPGPTGDGMTTVVPPLLCSRPDGKGSSIDVIPRQCAPSPRPLWEEVIKWNHASVACGSRSARLWRHDTQQMDFHAVVTESRCWNRLNA
ncbi:hypothetical protein NHX12_013582 [Muraenolepis orangiensis]|uniref:Uncharacterized protein n=1 Tax=Muraenolepis orangiensis TaxID=630683 RepID=A0A9Q0I3T2_9TELE|nr:hypothetical protein NHX12_013582 [Muraenolepis orangiensis]